MKPFLIPLFLVGWMALATPEASVANESSDKAPRSLIVLEFDDMPLAGALAKLNATYGLQVQMTDARWAELPVTGTIPADHVSVMIKTMLRDIDFVLERKDNSQWLLSVHGPINQTRHAPDSDSVRRELFRNDEVEKGIAPTGDFIEFEGLDGMREIIRVHDARSPDSIAEAILTTDEDAESSWIELEGLEGMREIIRAPNAGFLNNNLNEAPSTVGGIEHRAIELEGPDGIREIIRIRTPN